MKFGKLVDWVSLSALYDGPLFTLYNSSYKYFKIKLFKLHCHLEDMEKHLLFQSDFSPRSLLYWQRPTRFVPRAEYQLTLVEREVVDTIR